jgi:hypothetical protein
MNSMLCKRPPDKHHPRVRTLTTEMEASSVKRKRESSPYFQSAFPLKKSKGNTCFTDAELMQLLDFSGLDKLSAISDRFDQVGNVLLHDYILVVRCGKMETEFRILELEFYLRKHECHEDPFTHESEEQKICGRWCAVNLASLINPYSHRAWFLIRYFHRAPRRSADSHRSVTSLTGYRGGTRKGLDLTIGRPLSIASPYFASASSDSGGMTITTGKPLLRGGALLRTLQRISDSKVISGPSVLVDQILLLSQASSISDLVEHKWARDTSAFLSYVSPNSHESPASLYLKPLLSSDASRKSPVYRSPRIGLELSHPGTTPTPTHPRVFFLAKRYRYFIQPHLLTSNGRTQTFLGVLQACVDTGLYGEVPLKSAALWKALADITGLKSSTVAKYICDYQAGIDGGSLKSFVGSSGKGASGSPSTYLRMMGTLASLRLDTKETAE